MTVAASESNRQKADGMWTEVCKSSDVTTDDPKAVQVGKAEIGLFRVNDELFAIDNICSHEYAYLTRGLLEGEIIECPLHEAKFCVRTGSCLQGPAVEPLTVFPVKEDGDAVFVMVPDA